MSARRTSRTSWHKPALIALALAAAFAGGFFAGAWAEGLAARHIAVACLFKIVPAIN